MTPRLEQAIAALEKLDEDTQDAIAARLLAEAADEQAWDERFRATTDETVETPRRRGATQYRCSLDNAAR